MNALSLRFQFESDSSAQIKKPTEKEERRSFLLQKPSLLVYFGRERNSWQRIERWIKEINPFVGNNLGGLLPTENQPVPIPIF